ncbi:hypothetical protein AM500_08980 [Bacillus sp. FJAT-18017]|uniref:hypothetical protein n=1 Tax=Bacillus sp. FJAT-18017 TaxID=1705566 RepID=UPI0006AE5050|nr:hypothetical protein [Bacillus sp. FJAT-18017]ALC89895.1 hypothetical protein AM500_08980 [Bacillus sp. FJAT-18017]
METIILFIIIAAISTFFGKAKENPNEKRRRSLPELKKEFQEVYKEVSRADIPKSLKEIERRTTKKTAVPQPKPAEPLKIADKAPVKASRVSAEPVQDKTEEDQMISVSEKNLADAVVWAEILGPPRSKRPHYRR